MKSSKYLIHELKKSEAWNIFNALLFNFHS